MQNIVCKLKYLVLYIMIFSLPSAYALSIQDYDNALKNNGCRSIPWIDLQAECVSRQSEMEAICKIEALKCDELKIPESIEERKSLMDQLKNAKDLNRTDEISTLERSLSTIDAKIKGAQDEAKRRYERNIECARKRDNVMSFFTQVTSKLSDEYSSLSDNNLRSVIDKLKEKLKKSIEVHIDAVNNYVGTERDRCDQLVRM